MEAPDKIPDKIYLNISPFSGYPLNKWYKERQNNKDIEYARTAALIKKAEVWINEFLNRSNLIEYKVPSIIRKAIFENFEKYMKGE